MARQATRLRAQCPLPGTRLSFACAVGAAATVAPYLSTDSRGRSPEPLCDLPHRLTGRNTTRNLFAFIAPQRYPSSAAWRWRNSSVESEDPIDTALVPPLERSGDVRYTLTALPALPQLSLLFRREPGPCIHAHTSSSGKIRRCCVDRLRSPSESVIRRCRLNVRISPKSGHVADIPDRQLRALSDSCTAARGAAVARLFDHLVGAGEERRWHVEAKRLGGFEVDDELVLGRRLHRQVGWLLALEDAVDVAGCLAELIDEIRPIRHQTAGSDKEAVPIGRRQLVPRRKGDDQLAVTQRRSARYRDQTSVRRARERPDGLFDLGGVAHVDRNHLDSQRRRHCLHGSKQTYCKALAGIAKDCNARHARRNLLEQLQPFSGHAEFH